MRVAYVSMDTGVPVFGSKGCSIHVQEIIRAFVKRGADVDLFTTRAGGGTPSDLGSVRVHCFPSPADIDAGGRELHSISQNLPLRQMLDRRGPFDLVYERYSLWSYEAMEYAYSRAVPGVLEVNAPLIEEQIVHRGLVDRQQAETIALRVFGTAHSIVAVSTEVANYLERFSVARGRVHVIPNGVNVDRFRQRSLIPNVQRSTFTVGFVGTLKPWHGLRVLVEAFDLLHAEIPNTRLLIVGDGPEGKNLRDDLKARRLMATTHITGKVEPQEIPALLASMDAGVAPYDDAEDFYFSPLKVYEYMAAGLPVVVSSVGQLADLIRHDENGLLCTPGDAVSLASALARLQRDSSLAARLGIAARTCVELEHTWDVTLRRILDAVATNRMCQASRKEVAA
jgi:glycosyltransferase involved in cell wall biosynthesis